MTISVRLTEKIKDYFDWLAKFPGYSFNNQILIYIQKRDATKVNSKSGWAKLGYTPKENAQQIIIWRPTLKPPTASVKKQRKEDFMKKFGKGGKLSPEMEKKMEKMINDPIAMMPFVLYPVYDISEVANDQGEDAASMEKPKLDWFSTEENEVAESHKSPIIEEEAKTVAEGEERSGGELASLFCDSPRASPEKQPV